MSTAGTVSDKVEGESGKGSAGPMLVAGGAGLIGVGAILSALSWFQYASIVGSDNYSVAQFSYQIRGIGELVFGIGLAVALLGLARR